MNLLEIAKENCGIFLVNDFYGPAKPKGKAIAKNKLTVAANVMLVVAAIYERDLIVLLPIAVGDLTKLLTYKRSDV